MVSIIIPTTLKTKDYLDFCVKSIEENTKIPHEIIIGLNGEGTTEPQGQWRMVNKMTSDAKYDWIFLLNDDMYCPKNWDKGLIFPSECFSTNTNWISAPDPRLPAYVELNAGLTLEDFNKEMVDNYESRDYIVENGFNFPLFFTKKLWEKVDGFDENYDPWGSNGDSDFEYKCVLAGVQPKIQRGVFIYHFGQKSGTFDPERQGYWQKNWDYFIDKWGFPREDTPDIQQANLHIPMEKLNYIPSWSKYV